MTIESKLCSYLKKNNDIENLTPIGKEYSIKFSITLFGEVKAEISNQFFNFLSSKRLSISKFCIKGGFIYLSTGAKRYLGHYFSMLIDEYISLCVLLNKETPRIILGEKGYKLINNEITLRFCVFTNVSYGIEYHFITPIFNKEIIEEKFERSYLSYIKSVNKDILNKTINYNNNVLIKSNESNEFKLLKVNILDKVRDVYGFYISNRDFVTFDECVNFKEKTISFYTLQEKLRSKTGVGRKTTISIYRFFHDLCKKNIERNNTLQYAINTTIDYEIMLNSETLKVSVLSGIELQKAYCTKFLENKGELNNSCMNYSNNNEESKNNFNEKAIQFYAENSETISVAVIKDNNNKIICRAVLWTAIDGRKFLDRIYFTQIAVCKSMINFIKQNNIEYIYSIREKINQNIPEYSFNSSNYKDVYSEKINISFNYIDEASYCFIEAFSEKENKIQRYHGSYNSYCDKIYIPYLDNFCIVDIYKKTLSNMKTVVDKGKKISCYYTNYESEEQEDFVETIDGELCRKERSVQVESGYADGFYFDDDNRICYCSVDEVYARIEDCEYHDKSYTYCLIESYDKYVEDYEKNKLKEQKYKESLLKEMKKKAELEINNFTIRLEENEFA